MLHHVIPQLYFMLLFYPLKYQAGKNVTITIPIIVNMNAKSKKRIKIFALIYIVFSFKYND